MPLHRRQLRRFEHPDHGRYLTCSCHQRLALFGNDQIKDSFTRHLESARQKLRFELFAYVVMPEHIHLLIRTGRSTLTVTRVLRHLKAGFAQRVIARWRELDAPILARIRDGRKRCRFWQPGGGYDRNITSHRELIEKIQYIHNNPVRRGLASSPIDWRWSSAGWYEGRQTEAVMIDPVR